MEAGEFINTKVLAAVKLILNVRKESNKTGSNKTSVINLGLGNKTAELEEKLSISSAGRFLCQ